MTQDKPTMTAMMELIEDLKLQKKSFDLLTNKGYSHRIEYCIEKATELLAKEKEDIMNAFVAGSERGTKDIPFNAEQYFTQTYKQ